MDINLRTMRLTDDQSLTIQLLSFDRPDTLTERFYFLEMSTLQATTLVNPESRIIRAEICAYTKENVFISQNDIEGFKTIADFNHFFLDHSDYYIQNCEIEIETGLEISSHDDGEVSIRLQKEGRDRHLIRTIFQRFNLKDELLSTLTDHPGHYIAIDGNSAVVTSYASFDDYVKASWNLP